MSAKRGSRSAELALVQCLARAVSEHGPARKAAEQYAAHLAQSRGADEATLTARERTVDAPAHVGGDDLPVSHRLYCAELSVVLLELSPLQDRLGASHPALVSHTEPTLMGWVDQAPGYVSEALADNLRQASGAADPFEDVAQQRLTRLLPAVIRHDLGIHFTPGWTAREVAQRALGSASPDARVRVADPACGTGVFLLEAFRWKWHAAGEPRDRRVWGLVSDILGVEASPLVACVARLALLRAAVALAGLPLPAAATGGVRVLAGDVLCDLADSDPGLTLRGPAGSTELRRVQVLLGNPPWVAWDALPGGYKQRLAGGLLAEYHLFDLRGFEARLGGANDDLSVLFTLVVLDRLLVKGGRLAFLLKLNLLTNESARTFRRFRVVRRDGAGPGVPFAVQRLCDLRKANPFAAAVEPALLILARDEDMGDRLPSERWERGRKGKLRVIPQADYTRVQDGDGAGQGPWALSSRRRRRSVGLAGTFPYDIRHGLKHDCNGVYLVELLEPDGEQRVRVRNRPETARRIHVPDWTGSLERRFVRPLLQSRHIRPLAITGWAHALVPVTTEGVVDPQTLAAQAPDTYAYLDAMRPVLATRRSKVFQNPPFYRVFAVGPYSWAPSLVVWCGMALRPWFAVVDQLADPLLGSVRPLPDSSCYLVPLPSRTEACYLAGLLNSGPVREFLASRSSGSKRGLSRAVVSRLGLPKYDASQPTHRSLSRAASRLCRLGTEPVADERIAKALDSRADAVLR